MALAVTAILAGFSTRVVDPSSMSATYVGRISLIGEDPEGLAKGAASLAHIRPADTLKRWR
jgi:hypothetical protein